MNSYLKIDSSKRINLNSTTAAQFSIRSTRTVFHGRYELKSIYIPITFFNINQFNNAISFTDTAGPHTCTITPGFYTTNTYIPAVALAMTLAGSGSTYTATKSNTTQCITVISSTDAFAFTFGSNQLNSAAITLGYLQQDTAMLFSQTASGIVNVAQTKSFNISVNNYVSTSTLDGIGYSFVIPVTAASLSFSLYEPLQHYPQSIYIDSPTQQLDIGVYDDNHQLMQVFSDFYMILQPCSS